MAALPIDIRSSNTPPPTYEPAIIKYTPWKLHSCVTLERLHAPSIAPSSNHTRAVSHPNFTSLLNGSVQIVLFIERILSRKVAVVGICSSSSPTRWVVKFLASDWASRWHLNKELNAYATCEGLQGKDVPFFYGEWRIAGTDPDSCSALLMEYVAPATTISALRDRGWEGVGSSKSLVRAAVLAIEKINRCRVAHNNLCAEDMVFMEEGRVVIVGFAWAAVGYRSADRWSLFQMGFLTGWDVPELVCEEE